VSDHPLHAPRGQARQDLLQLGDVPGHDLQQVVGLARHVEGGDDLGQGPDVVLEDPVGAGIVAAHRGRHPDLQGEPGQARVDLGADDPDQAGLLQCPDPVQGRRGRQPGQAGQVHVGAVSVGLQLSQQLNVNFIKLDCHFAEYYFV
jgi:hypothetical protein